MLVTTLTKRMAEDLTDYLQQAGVRVRYLHSDIDAIERMEILRGLRLGDFDVLVGINLLREGLDLPEVSLVAILDADQEGFLRSDRSLIQTVGRAARNVNGRAILYADRITGSMQRALDEMDRRREIQQRYNMEHGITPRSIIKSMDEVRLSTHVADARTERSRPEGCQTGQPRPPRSSPARCRYPGARTTDARGGGQSRIRDGRHAPRSDQRAQGPRRSRCAAWRSRNGGATTAPARVIRQLDEEELTAEGVALGQALPSGSLVTFEGDLGAGKTTFIRAIARGLGVAGAATSPTYALVHRYHGRRGPVFHLDCYRLRSPEEAADLDWEGLLR